MNTPAHVIFGLAAFGRPGQAGLVAAAIVGALIPDASLYVLAGWELFIAGTDPEVVFGEMYFSDGWQAVFRVDNSAIVWGVLLGAALVTRTGWAVALCGAALLHLALDFPLHAGDGRAHFWPLTTWVFHSPISYWDTAHYGRIVGPVEAVLALLVCGWMWRRYTSWAMRGLIATLGAAQALPVVIWVFFFTGGQITP